MAFHARPRPIEGAGRWKSGAPAELPEFGSSISWLMKRGWNWMVRVMDGPCASFCRGGC